MNETINDKTENKVIASNLFWRFADRIGTQAISSIVSIVVTRILDPSAFAVVALVNTFITIFTFFSDFGLGDSLIQKKDADDLDFSSVFYINTAFCLFIYLIIFISAPYIARFYNDELLCSLLRVSSLTVVISSIKNIQHAYVAKNLMFKKFFFASLIGTILSGIFGIVIALLGYGPWALVISHLIDVLVDTIFTWFAVNWRPKLMFSFERVRNLFNFSSKLLISNFLNLIDSKLSQLIIGKFYNQSEFAFFNKGDSLSYKISNNIDYTINSVIFPVLSSKQDDTDEMKKISRSILRNNFYIVSPLLLGLFVVAKPTIIVLYTEKWLGVVPYLQIFCLCNLLLPIHTVNLNIIKSVGRSDILLKQEIIKKVITILIMIFTLSKSVILYAQSCLLVSFLCVFINAKPNKKLIGYSLLEQFKDIFDIVILDMFMIMCVFFVGLINMPVFVKLVLQIVTGGLVFVVLSYLTKNDVFLNLINIIKMKAFSHEK